MTTETLATLFVVVGLVLGIVLLVRIAIAVSDAGMSDGARGRFPRKNTAARD